LGRMPVPILAEGSPRRTFGKVPIARTWPSARARTGSAMDRDSYRIPSGRLPNGRRPL